MPPFQDLVNSTDFWSAVIIALLSGGGIVGAIITAISNRESKAQEDRENAEADKLAAEAAEAAVRILTDSVIQPLREQVESQGGQIAHLEEKQRKYFALTAYTRSLFHWLQQFCEIVEPEFLTRHPKPHLPDELRADVAPETLGKEP
ncbi:PRTRC system protein E [Bifidobacterium moukalabense]|uniref:PRTRC system protein E n=1 Tax=Bifidobacterium moukalabense TaxID=1333651 RepID=UPI0010F72FB0|nr:PRTRC system protein E [Bifidobacterium moukalabense]